MTAELYVAKRDFRTMVWGQMERGKLLKVQRNVKHRLPYFQGSEEAAKRIVDMDEFKACETLVINPDSAQETLRVLALKAGKSVFVPVCDGVHYAGTFCQLQLPADSPVTDQLLIDAARAAGGDSGGGETCGHSDSPLCRRLTVEQMPRIDLFVVGAVAVSKQGYRIGQGDGHSDMDYAVMRTAGRITDSTLVITCVHDQQVFDRLPAELFGAHDVAVDVIGTPAALLRVPHRLAKPTGVIWSLIAPHRLKPACVIRSLMQKQIDDGVDVKLSDECEEAGFWPRRYRGRGGRYRGGRGGGGGGGRFGRRGGFAARRRSPCDVPATSPSLAAREVRPLLTDSKSAVAGEAESGAKLPQNTVEAGAAERPPVAGRRRRRANTVPSERCDTTSDRAPRRRADEGCFVKVKLLPFEARRADLRAALDAVSVRATIQSFSLDQALLQLPSAEAARRLVDTVAGQLTVLGRPVPVRALGSSSQQQLAAPRHCVRVAGARHSPMALRHTLARLGFSQLAVRRFSPTAFSVELPDRQTVAALLARCDEVRALLGATVTLTELRGRQVSPHAKRHSSRATSGDDDCVSSELSADTVPATHDTGADHNTHSASEQRASTAVESAVANTDTDSTNQGSSGSSSDTEPAPAASESQPFSVSSEPCTVAPAAHAAVGVPVSPAAVSQHTASEPDVHVQCDDHVSVGTVSPLACLPLASDAPVETHLCQAHAVPADASTAAAGGGVGADAAAEVAADAVDVGGAADDDVDASTSEKADAAGLCGPELAVPLANSADSDTPPSWFSCSSSSLSASDHKSLSPSPPLSATAYAVDTGAATTATAAATTDAAAATTDAAAAAAPVSNGHCALFSTGAGDCGSSAPSLPDRDVSDAPLKLASDTPSAGVALDATIYSI